MDNSTAIETLSALAQETRLQVYRLLIEFGDSGAPAGLLSEELDIPHNTLSFHLSHLDRAGLVCSQKQGRSVIYRANPTAVIHLIDYLNANCCIRDAGPSADCRPTHENRQRGLS